MALVVLFPEMREQRARVLADVSVEPLVKFLDDRFRHPRPEVARVLAALSAREFPVVLSSQKIVDDHGRTSSG